MSEIIRIRDQYYILATSPLADNSTRVLKHGETFAIFDIYGDVRGLGTGEQGLYHKGTRHLSRSILTLAGERPLLLSSSVAEDNVMFAVDLTNPDMTVGGVFVPRGTLHVFRSIFLWQGTCYQRLRLFGYGGTDIDVELRLGAESDFCDIFEVRGMQRERRGMFHEPEPGPGSLVLHYDGLDGVERRTRLVTAPQADVEDADVVFRVTVPAGAPQELFVAIACEEGAETRKLENYASAIVHERETQNRRVVDQSRLSTSNELFNNWIARSLADLRMLTTDTPYGAFPYAGVPWFSAPFGRDSLLTAYQMLWVDPTLARGVLAYLAADQATEVVPERAAEPGKILHELRWGEMAALDEVPFGHYYGSVDSTPLFVAVAGEYMAFTGDTEFIRSIWPNIEAALSWMDDYGDSDGDRFIEYHGSERGLVQQGWKDSHDSVFHADGSDAKPPIALCEVQAYAYWARLQACFMASAIGEEDRATQLIKQATALREAFEDAFWLEDLGTYALALDGDKRPCAVRSSNAGHCLLGGIADPGRAALVASSLMTDTFFSGWGIRTLATTEPRFGPITYHNGSVWPHDNSLIAQGMANYNLKDGVHRILGAFLDASTTLEFHRLPELYCGFPRRPGQGPVEYPLACAPQAWAAGAPFLMLRACLGLSIDARAHRVLLDRPTLPPFLREVRINDLRAGDASVDLVLYADPDVGVNVTNREGHVDVVVVK